MTESLTGNNRRHHLTFKFLAFTMEAMWSFLFGCKNPLILPTEAERAFSFDFESIKRAFTDHKRDLFASLGEALKLESEDLTVWGMGIVSKLFTFVKN